MIRLSMKLPSRLAVAVSGGADSMAALNFLSRKKDVTALHFNHGTPHADLAQRVVVEYCRDNNISCIIGDIGLKACPPRTSLEDFWRKQRYRFFEESAGELSVITCHHLDDVIETWLFTSLHGDPRLIPSKRGRYLRPFLSTRKAVLEGWCEDKEVPNIFDPSNNDTNFMRNYIRHEIVPKALRVNPGLPKVLRKKIINNPVIFDLAF